MKTYTIIAGVNGCRKSSLTGVLRTEIDNLGKIIDVDKITVEYGGNMIEGAKKRYQSLKNVLKKKYILLRKQHLVARKH